MEVPPVGQSKGLRRLPDWRRPSMLIRKEEHESSGGRRPELAGVIWENLTPRLRPRSDSKHRLHNFTFPTMSWGTHWIFRCVSSVAGSGVSGAGFTPTETPGDFTSKFSSPEKPQLGSAPPGGFSEKKVEEGEQVENSSADAPATPAAAARPWNLRKRRAACFAPRENGRNRCPSFSSTNWLFGKDDPGKADHLNLDGREKMLRRKFSVSLSRQEIEEDFYAFKGMKPPRRPQKRARIVQRQLDALFPGLWLEDVTLDSYKVNE